jgi:hypothetical protein
MAEPVRIQLSRRKGFRLQDHSLALNGLPAVSVTRGKGRIHGNNFRVEDFDSVEECVSMFAHDLSKFATFHPDKFAAYIRPLVGKNLACVCSLDATCHADVLLAEARDFALYQCREVA